MRQDLHASVHVRIEYLKATIRSIIEHPFMGSKFVVTGSAPTIYCHNSYLQIWAEHGLVAFVYVVMAVIMFVVNDRPKDDVYQKGLYWGIVAFLIDNLTNFTLLRWTSAIFFFSVLISYLCLECQDA
jgi:O-antigen ligase